MDETTKSSASHRVDALLEGIDEAIAQSFNDCGAPALDCRDPRAGLIGSYCRVWWDGDDAWYDARILSFDAWSNSYYVW